MRSRLVVVTVAACVGLMVAAPAVAASGAWTIQSTPASDDVPLSAVSCATGGSCLALGPHEGSGNATAYAWNGRIWASVPSPAGAYRLTGVACTARSYCIVVGAVMVGSNVQAGAWSWNGRAWKNRHAYNPKSTNNILVAISCASPSSCEAVGQHNNAGGSIYAMAEYWNGNKWTHQSTTGGPSGFLDAVACESVGHCEAVGAASGTYYDTTLAMGLDGSKWVTQSTPGIGASSFTGMSCYSTGCTAVGSQGGQELLSEAWNGSSWSLQSLGEGQPPDASLVEWNGVHCQSASNCTAVGYWQSNSLPLTLADTWNGSMWTQSNTPDASSFGDALNAVSCTAVGSVCTAVGWQEGSASNTFNSLAMRN